MSICFVGNRSKGDVVPLVSSWIIQNAPPLRMTRFLLSMAPRTGFEPVTHRLTAGCSTAELSRNTATSFEAGEYYGNYYPSQNFFVMNFFLSRFRIPGWGRNEKITFKNTPVRPYPVRKVGISHIFSKNPFSALQSQKRAFSYAFSPFNKTLSKITYFS